MRSKAKLFETYAERCEELAAVAKDKESKRLLRQAAQDWLHLAAMQRSLQSDYESHSAPC